MTPMATRRGIPRYIVAESDQVVQAQRGNRQSIEIARHHECQQVAMQSGEISRWIRYPVDVLWSKRVKKIG